MIPAQMISIEHFFFNGSRVGWGEQQKFRAKPPPTPLHKMIRELSGDPQLPVLSEKYCHTNGRRIAVQMGGVLKYKWEVYSWVSLCSRLRRQEGTAIQMGGTAVQIGGVLQYFLRDLWVGVSETLLNNFWGMNSELRTTACTKKVLGINLCNQSDSRVYLYKEFCKNR